MYSTKNWLRAAELLLDIWFVRNSLEELVVELNILSPQEGSQEGLAGYLRKPLITDMWIVLMSRLCVCVRTSFGF